MSQKEGYVREKIREETKLRRKRGETKDHVIISNLSLHKLVNFAFKAHATRRGGMSVRMLVTDILTCWALYATPLDDPYFKALFPRGTHFPDVPERFSGYLAGLGFVPAFSEPESLMPPSVVTEPTPPAEPPPLPPERAMPPAYAAAHEQAEAPIADSRFGVGTFDPEAHAKTARLGQAQRADLGFSPPRREDL